MPVVIISYRQDWEHRCSRSCNCLRASGRSDFEMHLAPDEEEAASYIAKRIHEDPDAAYLHYLFDRWEDVVAQARYGSYTSSPSGAELSITVPYANPEDYEGAFEKDDEYEAEQARKNGMCSRIKELVTAKLGKLSEAAKQREREDQNRQHADDNRKRREREQAEYERLKKQFEPNK